MVRVLDEAFLAKIMRNGVKVWLHRSGVIFPWRGDEVTGRDRALETGFIVRRTKTDSCKSTGWWLLMGLLLCGLNVYFNVRPMNSRLIWGPLPHFPLLEVVLDHHTKVLIALLLFCSKRSMRVPSCSHQEFKRTAPVCPEGIIKMQLILFWRRWLFPEAKCISVHCER